MSGGGLIKRIAVTLWGIFAVLCGGLLLQRWEISENFRGTAPEFRQDLPVLGVYNETETAEKEGEGVVIYLDVLIAVNWLIDYLLLRGCARLTCHRGSNGRERLDHRTERERRNNGVLNADRGEHGRNDLSHRGIADPSVLNEKQKYAEQSYRDCSAFVLIPAPYGRLCADFP